MTSPLIAASGATFSYGRHGPLVVNDVDLVVTAGASTGIVGESGCGKTTLARMLVGGLEPKVGAVTVGGLPWRSVPRKSPLRRSVQMVFQDPYASLNPRLTPRETIAEVLQVWTSSSRRQALREAEPLLADVGLSQDEIDRRPGRLSGGQCQRVGIARALACRPTVVIADEPTSSLDVSVQAQILNLLSSLREQMHLALVLVSHDLSVIRYMADETLVMYRGVVVERGPTELLFNAPQHPYTRILLDSIPGAQGPASLVTNDVNVAAGCVFAHRCPRLREVCRTVVPVATVAGPRSVACHNPVRGNLPACDSPTASSTEA